MTLKATKEEKSPQEVPKKRRRFYLGQASLIAITAFLITLFTGGIAYAVQSSTGGRGEAVEGVLVDGVREFRIQAQQWYFSPEVIKVNPGDTVRFIVTSRDIMHGFAINELGLNVPLSPGGRVVHEVTIPSHIAEGTYTMYCSIFCGIGHPYMKGSIVIGNPGVEFGKFLPYIATVDMAGIFAAFIAIGRRRAR
jgi:cytochrome c oxidase subunit 2